MNDKLVKHSMYLRFKQYPELCRLTSKDRNKLIKEWFDGDKKSRLIYTFSFGLPFALLYPFIKPMSIAVFNEESLLAAGIIGGCIGIAILIMAQPIVVTYVLRNRFVEFLKSQQNKE